MLAPLDGRTSPDDLLTVDIDGDPLTVRIAGALDLATAPIVDGALEFLFEQRPADLVVDLGALSFIDSQGLNLLARLKREQRDRGAGIAFANVNARVRALLSIVGLELVLVTAPPAAAPNPRTA